VVIACKIKKIMQKPTSFLKRHKSTLSNWRLILWKNPCTSNRFTHFGWQPPLSLASTSPSTLSSVATSSCPLGHCVYGFKRQKKFLDSLLYFLIKVSSIEPSNVYVWFVWAPTPPFSTNSKFLHVYTTSMCDV